MVCWVHWSVSSSLARIYKFPEDDGVCQPRATNNIWKWVTIGPPAKRHSSPSAHQRNAIYEWRFAGGPMMTQHCMLTGNECVEITQPVYLRSLVDTCMPSYMHVLKFGLSFPQLFFCMSSAKALTRLHACAGTSNVAAGVCDMHQHQVDLVVRKCCLRGWVNAQTSLLSYRDKLEYWNYVLSKFRYH